MSVCLSAALPALATAAAIDIADILSPLRDRFWHERGMPRDFRSHLEPPSMAGSMKTQGHVVVLPDGLPYIAGVACGDNIRLTGIAFAKGVLWYGEMSEAKLLIKDTDIPLAMLAGLAGRRLADVVHHPAIALLDDRILGAQMNDGHLTLRTTISSVRIQDPLDRPTPRSNWSAEIEEMERRQGVHAA